MKKRLSIVRYSIILSVLVLLGIGLYLRNFSPFSVTADTDCSTIGDLSARQSCYQDMISQLQKQLDDAKNQEKTLNSQLDYIDKQNQITELKIQETQTEIARLDAEIGDLSGRITHLSTTVDQITNVLLNRIVQTYKYGDITPVDLLFSSTSFSDILLRSKYMEFAQENDKKMLYELQATKDAYNDQKTDKENRQAQQQKLETQLAQYQSDLEAQKKVKLELLKVTQNNETIYEAKIKTAQEEQNAILAILSGGGNEVKIGDIHKGDVVGHAIQGRSACSSGTHLHFEVHKDNALQDPNDYLSNTSFSYVDGDNGQDEGTINPHGSWDWPISSPITITQGFGMTPYARAGAYNGGPHTGIDMYSPNNNGEVRAVFDGTLYSGGISCGGGTLYYKKVDKGDGIQIYYLHTVN